MVELTPVRPDIGVKSSATPLNFGSADGPGNSGMQVMSCFESFKMCFTQLETHFTKSKPWGKSMKSILLIFGVDERPVVTEPACRCRVW